MDIPGHLERATDKLLDKQRNTFLLILTVLGVVLGYFTYFAPQIDLGARDYTGTEVELNRAGFTGDQVI